MLKLYVAKLIRIANKAETLAPRANCPCHAGGSDPHTVRGARAHRLAAAVRHQRRAWYEASRWQSYTGPNLADVFEVSNNG